MIPTADREELLDRVPFTIRGRRMAARLPIADLRRLIEERQENDAEFERLVERDG